MAFLTNKFRPTVTGVSKVTVALVSLEKNQQVASVTTSLLFQASMVPTFVVAFET